MDIPFIGKFGFGDVAGALLTRHVQQGMIGKTGIRVPRSDNVGVTGFGQPQSLLSFKGCANDPRMVTLTVWAMLNTSTQQEGEASSRSGASGPLVGMLSWGSGLSNQNYVEFDIPLALNVTSLLQGQLCPNGQPGGGATVSVPCSNLEFQVRNDASLEPRAGDSTLGLVGTEPLLTAPTCGANLGTGSKSPTTSLSRTIWVMSGIGELGTDLPPGASVFATIPPFAQSFVVMRNDAQAIAVTQDDSGGTPFDGPYNIPANAPCPEMIINNITSLIEIRNLGPGNISKIAVVYGLML